MFESVRNLLNRNKVSKSPYGTGIYSNIMVVFLLESWDTMTKEEKQPYINWAKKHLWTDSMAWRIIAKEKNNNGDLK